MSAIADFLSVPEWLRLVIALCAFAVALIVGIAALRAATILLVVAVEATWEAAHRLTVRLSELLIRLALAVVAFLGAALLAIARALKAMARAVWLRTGARAIAPFVIRLERMRQRTKLRRIWEAEYKDQFPTFAEFLEAFARGGKPRDEEKQERRFDAAPPPGPPPRRAPPRPRPPPPPRPPDPKRLAFVAACRLLGVPESGEFALQLLNARYRVLISAAHPDRGGSAQRAAAINAARDLIKSRKGWT